MNEFQQKAKAAGFTDAQIAVMEEYLSQVGHMHDLEDVEDLPETLEALGVEFEDGEGEGGADD